MINELLNNAYYDENDDRIYDYIANRVSSRLKLNIIKTLGNGNIGKAYLLNDNKVLKITTSPLEAQSSYKVLGQNHKHVSEIFAVYKLKYNQLKYKKMSLYAIILEYLEPLPVQLTTDMYDEIVGGVSENVPIEKYIKYVKKKYDNKYHNILIEFYKMYSENDKLEISQDIHLGNVGMKNNTVAAYDLMSSLKNPQKIHSTLKVK